MRPTAQSPSRRGDSRAPTVDARPPLADSSAGAVNKSYRKRLGADGAAPLISERMRSPRKGHLCLPREDHPLWLEYFRLMVEHFPELAEGDRWASLLDLPRSELSSSSRKGYSWSVDERDPVKREPDDPGVPGVLSSQEHMGRYASTETSHHHHLRCSCYRH